MDSRFDIYNQLVSLYFLRQEIGGLQLRNFNQHPHLLLEVTAEAG